MKIEESETKIKLKTPCGCYANCKMNFIVFNSKYEQMGNLTSCRELFSNYLYSLRKSINANQFGLMFFIDQKNPGKINKDLSKSLKILNDFEDLVKIKRTTIEKVKDQNILERPAFIWTGGMKPATDKKCIIEVYVVTIDNMWLISPATLSMQNLFLRVFMSTDHEDIKDFPDFYKKVKSIKVQDQSNTQNKDILYFVDIDKWIIMMKNILKVFNKKEYFPESWMYSGYKMTDGIKDFMKFTSTSGDLTAKNNMRVLWERFTKRKNQTLVRKKRTRKQNTEA